MKPDGERIDELAENMKLSMKIHADMIMSIDERLDRIAVTVDETTKNTNRNTESIKALTENAAKLDIKFERLAEVLTGLFVKHDERISALERKQ